MFGFSTVSLRELHEISSNILVLKDVYFTRHRPKERASCSLGLMTIKTFNINPFVSFIKMVSKTSFQIPLLTNPYNTKNLILHILSLYLSPNGQSSLILDILNGMITSSIIGVVTSCQGNIEPYILISSVN